MTQPQQWRFQWPDGTWIRWNPQTQSWEKEQGDPDPTPAASGRDAAPAIDDELEAASEADSEIEIEIDTGVDSETVADIDTDAVPLPDPGDDESRVTREPTPGIIRAGVSDVVRETNGRGGSLWPAIIAGAVVGIVLGIVFVFVIR